jgi:hypothetical protein
MRCVLFFLVTDLPRRRLPLFRALCLAALEEEGAFGGDWTSGGGEFRGGKRGGGGVAERETRDNR